MPTDIEQIILNELAYLRTKLDTLDQRLNGIMWKIIGLGTGSGAVGFVLALALERLLQ